MALLDDLNLFLKAQGVVSQSKQNLNNAINIPQFDVQDLIAEKLGNQIIANAPSVFNVADLLGVKSRVSGILAEALQAQGIGANGFFENLKNVADMSFLFNPGTAFDFIRPLAGNLAAKVSQSISELTRLKSLLTDYNTFIQGVPRPRLDGIDTAYLGGVKNQLTGIISKVNSMNSTFSTKNVLYEAERQDILGDLSSMFNSVTQGDNVYPGVERYVREIDEQAGIVKELLTDSLAHKLNAEGYIDNLESDLNLTTYTKGTFAGAQTVLESVEQDLVAAIDTNNKFNSINLQSSVAQNIKAVEDVINTIPTDIPATLASDPNRPDYDTLKSGLAAQSNAGIEDVINGMDDIVKKTKVAVVRDILPALNTDIIAFVAKLDAATSDLDTIEGVVQAYTPVVSEIGKSMEKTVTNSGLDKLQYTLTQGGFYDYTGMIANVATTAGSLAQSLAEEVAFLTANEQDEGAQSIALQLARNIAVGVHQTNMTAARAISQEVPGAISSLSKQESAISKMESLIRQFYA